MNETAAAIEACELRKSYGRRVALDGVSFVVARGEIVGLLGPNGAGKTTAVSILSGVLAADAGRSLVCGRDLSRDGESARRQLGLVPQSLAVYPTLSALENLEFFGRMQGLATREAHAAALEMLDQVGLADRAREPLVTFSGGMKRRLNLACGMLHRPAALLLDEPTTGVDPQSRERIFAIVEQAAARGTAILYNTHYMEEAERLCGRILLIDHGRIVAMGTAAEIIAKAGTEPRLEIATRAPLPSGWAGVLPGVRELSHVDHSGMHRSVLVLARIEQMPEVLRRLGALEAEVAEFHLHRPNLQDAFIALTGHALRDQA